MIRLQTLGSLDLRAAEGAAFQPVLRQSKRLALLAYLCIEKPGQFHRRDHLLGLFWPESDLRGGRASLSQAVHFLRQYLGKDAIINRGDEEIGVGPDIWCDAAAFQAHVSAGRYAEAMELYHGDLLAGVFVEQADGFEQWLEQKRDTFQRDAMRSCAALADVADAEGRWDDVVAWLRRAISYFPYDESLHRRLIAALDGSGDRAAALRVYDELEETLRREFEAEPSAETKELINAVRARTEAQVVSVQETTSRRTFLTPVAARALTRRRQKYGVAIVASILIVAAVAWGAWSNREQPDEAPANRIAVLFFNDASPNNELQYLADGLTTTLIDHLGQIRRLQVISENGVRPFRGDSIALDSIARQLDVGTIVGATINRSGDQLRVTVEMVKGSTGVVARSQKFTRPTGELFSLLDDISNEVAAFLRASLGEEIKLERYRRETESVPAWQAVQKAERLFGEAKVSGESGDKASSMALFQQVDTLLARAAQLDKRWAEPLVLRARMFEYQAWLSLIGGKEGPKQYLHAALSAADAALDRNEQSAAAFETRGHVRYVSWLMQLPPLDQSAALLKASESDLKRALSIDADRARAEASLSMLYESQGRYEEARSAARRALAADAYLEDAEQIVIRLFQASFELEDDDEAGVWCDEVRRRMPGKWPAAYCDLMLLGWRNDGNADARKALHILETFGTRERAEMRSAMQPRLAMLAAASVARAGDTALAERMVQTARANAPHDPELLHFEAAYRLTRKEYARGQQLIADFLQRYPNLRAKVEKGRIFRSLRGPTVSRAATN
jgi:DNA-binding SARP family transcriptional activator/TolB-like protein